MLKIKRRLETKRAPARRDGYGGNYTPSGIDIYTTDDPEVVSLDKYAGDRQVRVSDFLLVLDELDRYEGRRKLAGEKMELHLDAVKPEKGKGDVYHQPGWFRATPDEDRPGLIQLTVFSGRAFGAITLTADRDSLREALHNQRRLAEMERDDRERLGSEA